ncbi:AAA family ATPase [Streptomonospora sp. PA3]|uniref:AAA family ATPase n=1 Tax=Streptomonospora sp. PA3 TaxID=2607326 RepID=UPI0012DEB101|nr:AAA family ATPase [Streptomonospora sp. PA3]MUL42020.1 AAA family ATPase [Streptomonospora sp. PA3]
MRASPHGFDGRGAAGPNAPDRPRTPAGPRNDTAVSGGNVGAVVQAGSVHGDVHVYSHPAPETPHQIPLPPRHFTDRESELDRLETAADAARREGRPQIVVLGGPGGVGKTALATSFLHIAADGFPDGLLYADLRGFAQGAPLDPGGVLDGFLRALHTDPAGIALDTAGRAAQFRSRTAGRSMAFLLDSAASAAQVRLLLPGAGAHVVLVTTRLRPAGLAADGAAFMEVSPLADAAAAHLVERVLGTDRARGEEEAVRRLVVLCGRLPLALCAAASPLALRPRQSVARLADRLADERRRLDRLRKEEELSVRAALDASYAALSEPARRLYRGLGHIGGPDTALPAMAALLGASPDETEEAADELVAAHLLEEHASGRFRQHDLNRLHSRRLLEDREAASRRRGARERLSGHYLDSAVNADLVLNPGRWHLGPRYFAERRGESFTDRAAALAWLEAELANLRAWIAASYAEGRHETAWQLCEALRNLFTLRRHFDAWGETYGTGLAAARTLGDPAAQAFMLEGLGARRLYRGEAAAARERSRAALELWTRAGHQLGRASALEDLGVAELAMGAPAAAAEHFAWALRIHRRLGRRRGMALMRRRLGEAARDRGDHAAAAKHFQQALDFFTESAEPYMRLRTLVGLGADRLAAGTDARAPLTEALRIATGLGADAEVANIQVLLADIAAAEGRAADEFAALSTALSIYSRLGAPQAAEIGRRIGSPPPHGNR